MTAHLLQMCAEFFKPTRESFYRRVYALVSQVPEGRVVTYGQVAAALGDRRQARTVGWAMRVCPAHVPWHRVVNAKGRISIRPLHRGFNPQRALLEDEGVVFDDNDCIDLDRFGWDNFGKV